ncbi:MAG: hypothetical protein WAM30_02815 [Candidatus Dormiibacterota bacterium]
MTDTRRTILERVASGELNPEEAAALLDQLEHAPATGATATEAPPFEALATGELQQVRVVRNLGAAQIVGDRDVLEAIAEGPHRAERRGGILVIHSEVDEAGGFTFSHPQSRSWWQWDRAQRVPLSVRMRPDLPLDVQVQGGSVQVSDVVGPIKGDVQAGMLNLQGVRGPLELAVQAGNISVSGLLDHGVSKLRCEAGSIRVVLEPGSNVHIVARSTMGHLSLPGTAGGDDVVIVGGGRREATIGDGTARLELEATMGSIRVSIA